MTPQAKNQFLAFMCIGMMLVTLVTACQTQPAKPQPISILIPKDTPEFVEVPAEPAYNKHDFECLRTDLYFEAGNQSKHGMEAAALVVLIRTKTKGYPSTVCGVVKDWAFTKRGHKVCAFSWYCDRKSDIPNLNNKAEREAWEQASVIAERALKGEVKNTIGRATHYHADYVHPRWADAKRFRLLGKVGKHLFYEDTLRKAKA